VLCAASPDSIYKIIAWTIQAIHHAPTAVPDFNCQPDFDFFRWLENLSPTITGTIARSEKGTLRAAPAN